MTRLGKKASLGKAGAPGQPSGRLRALRVEVRWNDGALGFATLTVDDQTPGLLMIDGAAFMRADLCGVHVDRAIRRSISRSSPTASTPAFWRARDGQR